MQNNFVSWNPCVKSQLISYSENRLRLLEFNDEQSNSNSRDLREIRAWDAPQVQCLGWRGCADHSVVAYGTAAGYVHLVNLSSGEEVSVSQGVRLGKRQCNAVSWNKHMPSQLLAGFDSLKSEFCAVVWDFEHEHLLQTSFGESACSLSWLPDNAHSLAVGTAMGWVKVYDTRASSQVGAACSILAHPAPRPRKIRGIRADPFRPYLFATYSDYPGDVVKIWDLRKVANPTSKAVVPPSFIVVPSSGSPSPSQPNSFSSQFASSIGGEAEAVVDVQWSTARAGVLAVATSNRRSVSFYSTSTVSGTSHVPIYSVGVPAAVQLNGLTWQAGVESPLTATLDMTALHSSAAGQNSPLQADRKSIIASMNAQGTGAPTSPQAAGWESFRADEELRNCDYPTILRGLTAASAAQHAHQPARGHPRLLVATVPDGEGGVSGGFAEVEVLDRIPLAISAAGGLLAVNTVRGCQVALSCGSINRITCLQFEEAHHMGREGSPAECYRYTDAGELMRHRCVAGYSADAYANIDVLAEELDAVYASTAALTFPAQQMLRPAVANTKAVYRAWVWMDRFESTVNEAGLTVANCGTLDILVRNQNQMQQSTSAARQTSQRRSSRHPTLGATVHTSDSRDLAKKLCGWIQMFGLSKGASLPTEAPSGTVSRSSSGSVMNKPAVSGGRGAAEPADSDAGANDDLLDVIVDELFLDSFERAAAIALWHGRIDLSVSILRRAIAQMEDLGVKQPSSPTRHEAKARTRSGDLTEDGAAYHQKVLWDAPYAPGYLQTISLVAMCFAGFHCPAPEVRPSSPSKGGQSPPPFSGPAPGTSSAAASTWASMCKHVVAQLALSKREATGYLVAACHFLLANLGEADDRYLTASSSPTPTGIYYPVVADTRLTMEDRVAFACTYLGDEEVVAWLERTVEHCAADGNIEGVLITGLSPTGLGVLQKYVDRYDDVQTVALLVSRVLDSPQAVVGSSAAGAGGPASAPTREWIWLHEYRNLLNKWEMFIERAYLDVELGKRYRRKAAMLSALSAPAAGKDRNSLAKRTPKGLAPQSQQSKSKAGRVLYRLPVHSDYPHFFLRCGFCGASLPVDGMQNIRPEHLRVQSNILNCCAACSKQLPRCYVCQLYMGMVNPYLELNRVMTQKRISADKLLNTPAPAPAGAGTGGSTRQSSSHADGDDASSHSGISGSWNNAQGDGAEAKDHNVVSFGKWFFFCQHCRHGGHANCVDQWFGGTGNVAAERKPVLCSIIGAKEVEEAPVKRMVCGVNGCDCRCVARL